MVSVGWTGTRGLGACMLVHCPVYSPITVFPRDTTLETKYGVRFHPLFWHSPREYRQDLVRDCFCTQTARSTSAARRTDAQKWCLHDHHFVHMCSQLTHLFLRAHFFAAHQRPSSELGGASKTMLGASNRACQLCCSSPTCSSHRV